LLVEAYEAGIQGSVISAASMGSVMAIMFFAYGLALWYGSKLIGDGTINPSTGVAYTGGDIVAVFFSVLMGSFAIGQAAPSVPAFASAKGAAYRIFEVIDRTPAIDASSSEGQSLPNLQGDIVFEDVHFSYPSRPDAKVLNGLNLRIPAGKTVHSLRFASLRVTISDC
jgi:ATP-binding cassette subfamily B (MDR/TAP) protein 1